jgi:hypothetical protein
VGDIIMNNLNRLICKIVKEVMETRHSVDRLIQRIVDLRGRIVVVAYELSNSPGEYIDVGTYTFSDGEIDELLRRIDIIRGKKFNTGKDYGILLGRLYINRDLVDYYSDFTKRDSKGKSLIMLGGEQSNGDMVYGIVRGNVFTTIMFVKSYVNIESKLMGRERLPVIHIKDFSKVESNQIRE